MKESMSVTTLFQIVILFILLFTAIMCLTINNANAFGVKDEIINIIELSEGKFFEGDSLNTGKLNDEIVNTIEETSYRTTGVCEDGYNGYDKNGMPVSSGNKASVCIKEVTVTDELDSYLKSLLGEGNVATDDFIGGKYYQIIVFYQLDIPVVNQVYKMQTKGETKIIYGDK